MDKELATFHLGGTTEQAARWIGVSGEVYKLWPERLAPVMVDRVYAAILRREAARAMGLTARQFFADMRGETFLEVMLARVSVAAVMAAMMKRVPAEYENREVQQAQAAPKRRMKSVASGVPAGAAAAPGATVITPQASPAAVG